MTLSAFTQAPSVTTDAAFRAAAQQWHDALSAVGLVQTSDTGQINLTTVTKPGAANTSAGYEIWRFADTLQATVPVYIKIEYGTGGGATLFGIWITTGASTDGAGTLGTIKTNRIQMQTTSVGSSTPWKCWISGSTSRCTLAMYVDSGGTNYASIAAIERIQDANGADTSLGAVQATALRNASSTSQVIVPSGNQPAALAELGLMMPFSSAAWAYGANVYTGPVFPVGWGVHPPLQGLLGYFGGDITTGASQTISVYGTNRTFYPVGTANLNGLGVSTSASLLVRYD